MLQLALLLIWNGSRECSCRPLALAGGSAHRELLVRPSGYSAAVAQQEPETHPHPIASLVPGYLWLTEEQIAREAEALVLMQWIPW